jgi:hypothetical protein
VVVERRAELGPAVGLDDLDGEGETLQHVVDELDRRLLIELGIDPKHPEPGAVVDGGELVELLPRGALDGWMNFTSIWTW